MTFGEKLKKARIESGLSQEQLAGNSWYLAERGSRQYLLNVTKEFITSQELPQHIGEKKFMIGELRYKRLYRLK